MTLVALDVNATRVRVLHGLSPREARPLALEGTAVEMPLAVSVEGRQPVPGRAGAALCRRSPHLACTGFLAQLGDRREWTGRCKIDALRALSLVLDHVSSRAGKHLAAAIAVPGYLAPEQRALLGRSAEQARLRLFGTIDAALAAALTAHAQQPWDGIAIVLDLDEHALTWTAVLAREGAGSILHSDFQTQLGERAWKERLLATAADACIRRSRRDPRDSAEAEQALYEQLDGLLVACQEQRAGEINVQTTMWSANLILSAAEVNTACRALLERTLRGFHSCCQAAGEYGTLRTVIVSPTASRLPGLMVALEDAVTNLAAPEPSNDPGEDLIEEAPLHVRVLTPDAVGLAVHTLAGLWHTQTLPPGHLQTAPLPEAQPPAAGLARLHFRGRDHLLRGNAFTLGRDPRCDLTFDTTEYPSISGQHCKIVCESHGFTLYDLSRHGTAVNDRPVIQQRELHPGDWIRLGPGGPLLRFLGHTLDTRKLLPTA